METQTIIKPEETQPLDMALATLRNEAKGIVVKTPDDYEKAGRLLVTINNYAKDVKNKLNPFVDFARRNLEAARQEMNKYLNGAEELRAVVSGPMADFKRQERLAAEAEERRINEERRRQAEIDAAEMRKRQEAEAAEQRKQREKEIAEARKSGELKAREAEKLRKEAEAREKEQREQAARDAAEMKANVQEVSVQPSTPKIAGTRGRVQYFAEFSNFDLLLAEYVRAADGIRAVDNQRKIYLRRFIMGNEQELGKEAREMKNSKRLMQLLPGVDAKDEDRI